MQLQLDPRTMKALSSKTRADILKLLGQRRYMQSELASLLNLSVPTVKEHLNELEKAELVEKHEEGRKWKYYSLTKKGKAVLQPSETTILLVLGLMILSIIGGILTTAKGFVQDIAQSAVLETTTSAPVAMAKIATPYSWTFIFPLTTILLAVLLAVLVQRYVHKLVR